MRKFLIYIIVLATSAIPAVANTDYISLQRDWAAREFADPADMSPQNLVDLSMQIIANNLQEEQAKAVVKETSKLVPEVKDWLKWTSSGKVDPLMKNTVFPLKALADYAETQWPDTFFSAYCMTTSYIAAGNIISIDDSWEQLISRFSTVAAADPSPANKGLLAMMKAVWFCQKTVRRSYDDPTLYPEIFEIEREALKAFPFRNDDNSMIRADLYFWLGQMKSLPTDDWVASVEAMNYPSSMYSGYQLTGKNSLYPGNSGKYFEKAFEIASAALNEGHPYVREIARQELAFRMNNFHVSDETYDEFLHDYAWVCAYFPKNSLEVSTNTILYELESMREGKFSADDARVRKCMENLTQYLGVKNPIYMQHLLQTASTFLFIDMNTDYWFETLMATMDAIYGEDESSDVEFNMLLGIYSLYYSIDPQSAFEKIDILLEDYYTNHSPTMISVLYGQSLAQFYANSLFDNATANAILFFAEEDLRKLLGDRFDSEPFAWEIRNMRTSCFATSDASTLDRETLDFSFRHLRRQLDEAKPRGDTYIKFLMLKDHAGYLNNTCRDYSEAAKLADEMKGLSFMPNDLALSHIFAAVMKQKSGDYSDSGNSDSYDASQADYLQARYWTENTSLTNINSDTYSLLSAYLFNRGEFNEALQIQELQLEAYQTLMGDAFSVEYLTLKRELAETYECLGRRNDARRILGEDTDMLEAAFGVTPTPALLDNLWLDYNIARNDNIRDMVTLNQKLNHISEATNRLLVGSGNADKYRYSYLVRYLSEIIYISACNYGTLSEKDLEDGAEKIGQALEMFDSLYALLVELHDGFQTYDPDYINNDDYRSMIGAMLAYQRYMKRDPAATVGFFDELTQGDVSQRNFTDYIEYAWYCLSEGMNGKTGDLISRISSKWDSLTVINEDFQDSFESLCQIHLMNEGRYEEALPYARSIYKRSKNILDGNFQLMTSREQENYMNSNGDPAASLTALMESIPDKIAPEAYDAITYRTGMQLRSQRETQRVLHDSDDPQVRMMLDSVQSLRASLLNIPPTTYSTSQEEITSRNLQVANINHRINRLERQLLESTRTLRQGTIADVGWQQIRDRLKPGEAAMEFFFSRSRVMAMILKPGVQTPIPVILCPDADLPDLLGLNSAKNSASLAKSLYENPDKGRRLYDAFWSPLEAAIGDCSTIYYSLPGLLSNIAVNAIPTPDGRNLFDRYNLVQLTTTGQLVFDTPSDTPASISMMGDILYEESQTPLSVETPGVRDIDLDFDFADIDGDMADGQSVLSRGISKRNFRHLPFTAIELDGIAGTFPADGIDSVRRHNATERRFHEMVNSKPKILHLATHGYYISPAKDVSRHPFFQKKGSGTMQRSGIALAGAEKTWRGESDCDDDEDGIVTASEVAALDLHGTHLVTLSACETALGDYSFEGIFGLQRGFKQAGAQSLLVSLWSVNDMSTSLFMTTFYSALRNGNTRQQSWREAVSKVRESYPSPYYWAPFILLDGL